LGVGGSPKSFRGLQSKAISGAKDKKTQPTEPWLAQERFNTIFTLLVPEGNSAFRQVVRRHLYHNFVSWQDPNKMQTHFSRDMRQDAMPVG
jgi:hypothetical protein